ncbi:MAG: hypothetical protein ACI9R3_004576 [Verrucomicrobiales bacterium]
MHKEILILSWLDGQMRFLFARNGKSVANWECSAEVEELGEDTLKLSSLLRTAVQETGYKGKNVGMILQHSQLTQQLLSTPPAKGRDLEIFLERQVDQLKVTDEDVVMSWIETEPIKTSKGLVLCLLPKHLQEYLIAECREAGLHLLALAPPTCVLGSEFSSLPIEDDKVAMLAARIGNTTTAVVARRDGTLFLARRLRCNWSDSKDRLNSELNRSTIFLRQQYGLDIDSIWLAGDGASEHAEAMRSVEDLQVKVSPIELTPFYWAERMLFFDPNDESNLVSREQRDAPKRKLFLRITGAVIGLLLLLSFGIVGLIEFQMKSETRALELLRPKGDNLTKQKIDLEQRFKDLEENKEISRLVNEERLPPVPGWFLNYLAMSLPDELVLTKVQVQRVDSLTEEKANAAPPEGIWKARLEGAGMVSAEMPPAQIRAAFKSYSELLEHEPFFLQITDATKYFAPRSVEAWISTDGTTSAKSNEFFIEGIIAGSIVR